MRQLSDKSRALFKKLESLSLERSLLSGDKSEENIQESINLMKTIAATREWPALLFLPQYLASNEKRICETAADAVELILHTMRISCLLQVDGRLRAGTWSVSSPLQILDNLTQQKISTWFLGKARIGLCGMTSFSSNGYLREAALWQLAKHDDGGELPFLLIRMCDWVPKICAIACDEVEKRIMHSYAGHLLDNLELLDRVAKRDRRIGLARRLEVVEKVRTFLKSAKNRDLLIGGLSHADLEVRRWSLLLLSEIGNIKPDVIMSRLLQDSDLTTRHMAFQWAERLPPAQRAAVFKQLLDDKAGTIRRDALRALCPLTKDQGRAYVIHALMDKSATVRDYARWKLGSLEPTFDMRQFYLKLVQAQPRDTVAAEAIYGLGETGQTEDGKIVFPFIEHGRPAQQRAAISAIAKLGAKDYVDELLALFVEGSESISSAAGRALEKVAHLILPDTLWEIVVSHARQLVKLKALKLLNKAEKWERVIFMLQALSTEDKSMKDFANASLGTWQRQYELTWTYTLPSASQKIRLVKGMKGCAHTLSDPLRAMLEVCLKPDA